MISASNHMGLLQLQNQISFFVALRLRTEKTEMQQEREYTLLDIERTLNEKFSVQLYAQNLETALAELWQKHSDLGETVRGLKADLHKSEEREKSFKNVSRDLREMLKATKGRKVDQNQICVLSKTSGRAFNTLMTTPNVPTEVDLRRNSGIVIIQKPESPRLYTALRNKLFKDSNRSYLNDWCLNKHSLIYGVRTLHLVSLCTVRYINY